MKAEDVDDWVGKLTEAMGRVAAVLVTARDYAIHKIFTSPSTCLNSLSPVTSSAFRSLARAATKQDSSSGNREALMRCRRSVVLFPARTVLHPFAESGKHLALLVLIKQSVKLSEEI